MKGFMDDLRDAWLYMFEPPWRSASNDREKRIGHWVLWLWIWSTPLSGLVLGALVAPSLVQIVGLANTPYTDWLVIAIAVLAGFLVQLLSFVLILSRLSVVDKANRLAAGTRFGRSNVGVTINIITILATSLIALLLPLAGVSYGIYRYLTWEGAGQREATIAFIGGLLIKTFVIPFIKGIVTGTLFRWIMKWLRGGKDTKSA